MRNILFKSNLFLLAISVFACTSSAWCADGSRHLDGLLKSNCATEKGVLVLKYGGPLPTSPYATDFDKRELFIASSSDFVTLARRVGVKRTKQGIALDATLLASPPEPTQIESRHVLRKALRKGSWTIFFEDIQYATQGSAIGFPIECGTAIQLAPSKERFVAASECFAYEDKGRFLSTLSKIDAQFIKCESQ